MPIECQILMSSPTSPQDTADNQCGAVKTWNNSPRIYYSSGSIHQLDNHSKLRPYLVHPGSIMQERLLVLHR